MKNMKKILLIGLCLWSVLFVRGQQIIYEYTYDDAGNRVSRAVVQLNGRDCNELRGPLTNVMSNGETMLLFPNPTKGSIRFELSGDQKIGRYTLSDVTGRLIANGVCENPSLVRDLSEQREGIYLLELFIEEKPNVFKIIKQ